MLDVRFHGRGGQGVVTAAELLSAAAFLDGHHAQAFPSFGSERTGAPVVAFCRVVDAPIRSHEPISRPDVVVIQDPTLLHQVDVFAGLAPTGFVLVNSARPSPTSGSPSCVGRFPAAHVRDRPGERAGARAPRPAAAGRAAARRAGRGDRARHRRCARRGDPRALPRRGWARPTWPPPRPRCALVEERVHA